MGVAITVKESHIFCGYGVTVIMAGRVVGTAVGGIWTVVGSVNLRRQYTTNISGI